MGCEHDVFNSNCVCDILLDIVEAQEKVDPTNNHCISGCSTALDELCGGPSASAYTTIPVSLVCKGSCDYFIGRGVRRNGGTGVNVYEAVAFRVVDVDPETCCATLELLQSVPVWFFLDPAMTQAAKIQFLFSGLDFYGYTNTGICITVDLNCFCGVTCHPATTPASWFALTADQLNTITNRQGNA